MIFTKIKEFFCSNWRHICKYIGSGALSVGIDYAILFLLTEWFGLYYLYSVTVSYFCGFFANFFLNKYWTFQKKEGTSAQMLKYALLAGTNYLLTLSIMYLLTSLFGVNYLISRGMVLVLVVCWNFLLYKKVVYR
ncbi:MAG: GtrA family protein [Nanoarchaeota archaeon]